MDMPDGARTHAARTGHNTATRAQDVIWLLERRRDGWTIREISEGSAEGIGRHLSRSAVHKAIEKELTRRKAPSVEGVRQMELDRLDNLERKVRAVLDRQHVTLYQGAVVRDDEGEPMLDDSPVMTAAVTLLKIGERRSRLKGLDAPVQVQQETTAVYKIVGVDPSALT